MVAYAVGEMERPPIAAEDAKDTTEKPDITQTAEDGNVNVDEIKFSIISQKSGRPYSDCSCYEVVTAWVHPR